MLIGGVIAVLIEQDLLNYLANTVHVELVVARHPAFSFTGELVIAIKLN